MSPKLALSRTTRGGLGPTADADIMSHQIGSFLGAYGGGVIYDALGPYNMARRIGVALGLAGGIIQVAFALTRPSQPPTPVLPTA